MLEKLRNSPGLRAGILVAVILAITAIVFFSSLTPAGRSAMALKAARGFGYLLPGLVIGGILGWLSWDWKSGAGVGIAITVTVLIIVFNFGM